MEEIYWKQRAKIKWLVHGDNAFFYNVANNWKKFNWISNMEWNGVETLDIEDIKKVFLVFFKGIFDKPTIPPIGLDWNSIYPPSQLGLSNFNISLT